MSLRRLFLVAAAIAAAVTSAQAMRLWLQNREPAVAAVAAPPPSERRKVLVAARAIAAGSFVTADSLVWQEWPDVTLPEAYVVDDEDTIESFAGAVARRDLAAGEPVTAEKLVRPGERGFLAAVLEPGMRAVSVPIDEATGNAGLVFPGDRVDLVLAQRLDGRGRDGSASEIVLQNARVLAVGRRLSAIEAGDEAGAGRERTVTLEVTPEGAKRVALALELGKLMLSLRSLARAGEPETPSPAAGADAPLFDTELSQARSARRGVLVLRGSQIETVNVTAPAPAEENSL